MKATKATKTTKVTLKNSKDKVVSASFPKQELLSWVHGRQYWNHNDWLTLLNDLNNKGWGHLTQTQEGQNKIGNFLEENRISSN